MVSDSYLAQEKLFLVVVVVFRDTNNVIFF